MHQWLASPETEAKPGNFTQTTWLPAGPQGLSCTSPCCTPWGSSQPTSPSCPGPSGESATPPILYSWRSESERRQTDKSQSLCLSGVEQKWQEILSLHKLTPYLHSIAFSSDLNVLGRLRKKFCMLFNASMAVPKTKCFHFMACSGIIYIELATRECHQRELGLKRDLMHS